ncbi:Fc.00g071330.m01.CDS01 [Cosmosporella sp. VM-42]
MADSSSPIPDHERSFEDTPPSLSPLTPTTELGSYFHHFGDADRLFRSATPAPLATELYHLTLDGQLQTAVQNNWHRNHDLSTNPRCPQSAPGWGTAPNGSPGPRQFTQFPSYERIQRFPANQSPNFFPSQSNNVAGQVNRILNNLQPRSVPPPLDRDAPVRQPSFGAERPQDTWRSPQKPSFFDTVLQQRPVVETPALARHDLPNVPGPLQHEARHDVSTPVLRPPPGLSQIPTGKLANPTPRSPVSGFRPMAALGQPRRPSMSLARRVETIDPSAFSGNYRGEHNIRNASAANLTDEENCALWLTNLPPDVTHRELLAGIRNIGRIWCTVINPPDYERHVTAAAKVVFFTPQPAQQLLVQALSRGLVVRDRHVKVTHNRVKYGQESLIGNASRILIITGQSNLVNEATLTKFFKERFIFEVDDVQCLITAKDRSVVQYCFGSYRCQAQMGKMALEKDRPAGFEKVEFGEDPCEVGDTMSAYGVAGRRIQGLSD